MTKKKVVNDIFVDTNLNKNNSSEVRDLSSDLKGVGVGVGVRREKTGQRVERDGTRGRLGVVGKQEKNNNFTEIKTPEDVIKMMSKVANDTKLRTFEKKTQMDYLAKLYDVLVREEERKASKGQIKVERQPIQIEVVGADTETNDRIKKLEKEIGLTDELRA